MLARAPPDFAGLPTGHPVTSTIPEQSSLASAPEETFAKPRLVREGGTALSPLPLADRRHHSETWFTHLDLPGCAVSDRSRAEFVRRSRGRIGGCCASALRSRRRRATSGCGARRRRSGGAAGPLAAAKSGADGPSHRASGAGVAHAIPPGGQAAGCCWPARASSPCQPPPPSRDPAAALGWIPRRGPASRGPGSASSTPIPTPCGRWTSRPGGPVAPGAAIR